MKIIALIPARKNSVRFPGKNYALFLGKPLFMHSVEFATESKFITEFYVTTNDDYIINYCHERKIPYIVRPEKYCLSTSPSSSFISHYLDVLEEKNEIYPEAIVVLQPTDPVRKQFFLNDIIKLFIKRKADCVFTVVKAKTKMGRIINGNFQPYNYKFEQRFQDIEQYFEENGMLYLIRVKSFLKYNSIFGVINVPYQIPDYYRNIDIDTELELDIAELTYHKHIKNL